MTDRTDRKGTRRRGGALVLALICMAPTGALVACTDRPSTPAATGSAGPSTSLPTSSSAGLRNTGTSTTTGAGPSSRATAGPISPSELAAQPDSPAGATAFGHYLVSQVNAAYRIPDPSLYDTIVAPGCETCNSGRTYLQDTIKAGQRAEADIWSVTSCVVLTWGGGQAAIDLRIQQHRVGFVDSLGRRVDESKENTYRYELTMSRVGNSWKVTQWLNIQS